MTDSKAPWLARGSAIALMMAAGIALAACGGGGGLNEDESATLQERLDTAEADAAAADAAREVAEAEAAAAETAKATAEAEKATAEAEKAVADTAREVAVAEAAAAETAKATAEAEKATAEAEKVAADTAREAAEADAAAAETARLAAEAETAAADAARELAVAAREAAVAEAAAAQAATETAKAEAAVARTDQQAAETAQAAAEMARIAAEENAAGQMTQAETANMAAQVAAAAVEQANAALIMAQDEQKKAEDERDAAIAARDEAQRLLGLARAATALAEQQGRDAEAEQDRLEQENEEARQELIQVQAQQVFLGLVTEAGTAAPTLVTASYNENASVATAPPVTFSSTTGRAARPWFVTSFSNRTASNVDRLDVYTDVERLPDIPFKDSDYNDGTTDNLVVDQAGDPVSNGMVVDAEGDVINRLRVTGTQDDTASSSFPRTTVTPKSFNLFHRGMTSTEFEGVRGDLLRDFDMDNDTDAADRNTQGFRDALETAGITRSQFNQYIRGDGVFRDTDRHPFRYSVEFGGSLGGADGTYRCGGANKAVTCDVDYRGGKSFNFDGAWSFAPSRGTVGVDVVDETYMYFGLWSRENLNPGQGDTVWSFRAFHGGNDSRDDDVDDVNGTATYSGPAVGYYAIYQPLGTQSDHGEFSATATLTADFDSATETLEGRIDQFSGHSDWFLTLKRQDIAAGAVTASTDDNPQDVSWSIGGIPHDGGKWGAAFYSNLDSDKRANTVPSGVAGNFEAEYSTVGRLIGAFGAHCRTGC